MYSRICRITRLVAIPVVAVLTVVTSVVVITLSAQMAVAQSPGAQPKATPGISAIFSPPANSVDWSHYDHPSECQHIVMRMIDSVAWGRRADTMQYQLSDTLPTIAVQAAQRCLGRFPIAAVRGFQLPILLNLAIQSNDDATVREVIAQQLALTPIDSVGIRAAILDVAVRTLVDARPARVALAQVFANQADSLGDKALWWRATIQMTLQKLATYNVDLDGMMAHSKVIIDYLKRVPLNTIPEVYRAQIALLMIPYEQANLHWFRYLKNHAEEDFTAYAETMRSIGHVLVGLPAPAVAGDFWFSRGAQSSAPVSGPVAMKSNAVSLVVFIDQMKGESARFYGYAWLKRLQNRFPDLQILLMGVTNGYFRDLEVPMTTQNEAAFVEKYLLDSLGLPGVLSLSTRSYQKYLNGMGLPQPVANESSYATGVDVSGNDAFVVDTRGRIVRRIGLYGLVGLGSAGLERMLEETIAILKGERE